MGDFSVSGGITTQSTGQINKDGAAPPNPLANDNTQGTVPSVYVQDVAGTWHAAGGIDTSTVATDTAFGVGASGPPGPAGIFTWFRNLFIRDSGSPTQGGKNALVSINHTSGTFTSPLNQDRALWITHATPDNDTADRYGIEGIQIEMDIKGAPNWIGSPDAEASTASFQLADSHTDTRNGPANFGVNAIRAHYFRQVGAGMYGGSGSAAVRALVDNKSSVAGNGGSLSSFRCSGTDTTGGLSSNVGYYGLFVEKGTTRLPLFNRGINIADYGTNTSDYNLFSISGAPNSGRNRFQGRVEANRDIRTGNAGNTDLAGRLTLDVNGTASYTFTETYSSAPIVATGNTTSTNGVRVTTTTTTLTLSGTAGEVINYIMVGRN